MDYNCALKHYLYAKVLGAHYIIKYYNLDCKK